MVAEEGFCSEPRLSPEAERALELVRIAAPDPEVILNEAVPIEDVVTGSGTPDVGVLPRLAGLLLSDDLAMATEPSVLYERFGLSETAFVEARAHLARELRAFGRDLEQEQDPEPLGRGQTSDDLGIPLYASTRNPPTQPQAEYYAAIARWDPAIRTDPPSTSRPSPFSQTLDETDTFVSVAHFVYAMTSFTSDGLLGEVVPGFTDLDPETLGLLGVFLSDATRQRESLVQMCHVIGGAEAGVQVHVWGSWSDTSTEIPEHILVREHAGLQCAVRAGVESSGCDLANYIVPSTLLGPVTASLFDGFTQRITLDLDEPGELTPDGLHTSDGALVFVVRLRDGGALPSGAPGAYEAVTGVFVPVFGGTGDPVAGYRCQTVPVIRELEEQTADAIGPSTTYCAFSAETCAGLPFDQRLALENELSDDFDPVESNYRRFLQLARDAADHADRLGEDLIRSGLEQDLRAEQAIDELENLCGVSLNIEGLSDPMTMVATGDACDGGTPCPTGYRCADGLCVIDPLEIALDSAATDDDRRRLIECLGDETIAPWVTLGASPVCLWWEDGDPSTICDGEDLDHPCPFERNEEATCEDDLSKIPERPGGLPRYVPIDVADWLGFFVAQAEPPVVVAEDPANIPCAALARLRSEATPSAEDIDAIFASQTFLSGNLSNIANRITWRPAAGDYSSILVDDAPFLSTGSAFAGPGERWPCGPRPFSDQCPPGAGLVDDPQAGNPPFFCLDISTACSGDPLETASRVDRARMNDMMARAVLAARIVSGTSLEGVAMPFYARSQDEVVTIPTEDGGWRDDTRLSDLVSIFSTGSGALVIANPSDIDDDSNEFPLFDMGRARAYVVDGSETPYDPLDRCSTIPPAAEWSSCPWDYNLIGPPCVEVFDDEPDCDDFRPIGDANERQLQDRDVGLIIRHLSSDLNGVEPIQTASEMWVRDNRLMLTPHDFRALIHRIMTSPDEPGTVLGPGNPATIEALTRYWQRSACGIVRDDDCGGPRFADAPALAIETARCFPGDPDLPGNFVLPGNGRACGRAIGCFDRYNRCISAAEGVGIPFQETVDGNRAFIAPRGLSSRDVLNGVELMCAVARRDQPGGFNCAESPEINDISDLFAAADHLDCVAASIKTSASRIVFRNFPQRAVDLMRRGGRDGVYGNTNGEFNAAVNDLRASLIELSDIANALASIIQMMGAEIRAVRSDVARFDIQSDIADLQLVSTAANQITACATSIAGTMSGDVQNAGAAAATAAITCTNTMIQIRIASRITGLQQEDTREAVAGAFARFEANYSTHARALAEQNTQLRTSVERIEASRNRIETIQGRGRRALSRALFLDADSTGRQYSVNTVMRRRQNTLAIRYREAHRRAVRLAYLAKIALEQRLGIPFDRLTEPLPLLDEPPADWHLDVCSMSGIDYDRIRQAALGETGDRDGDDALLAVPENYAGEYVGDYVRRLEAVLESYSLAFPFQDGTDTSVLSLRDELWGIRAPCEAEVPNQLLEAGRLDSPSDSVGTRFGWDEDGCIAFDPWPPDSGADPPPHPSCATATPLDDLPDLPSASCVATPDCPMGYLCADMACVPDPAGLGPISRTSIDFGRVSGYRVEFGDPDVRRYPDGTPVTDGMGGPAISITADTRLIQWVNVGAGRYRVSWYARTPVDLAGTPLLNGVDPFEAVRAYRATLAPDAITGDLVEAVVALPVNGPIVGPIDARNGWGRYYFFVDQPLPGALGVAVVPAYPTSTPENRIADVAALMLEDARRVAGDPASMVSDASGNPSTLAAISAPAPFFDTGQTRTRVLEVCEDITGETFRARAWTRGCDRLCPDGYGGDCSALAAETQCYFETSFTLDPEQLERAGLLGGGGLAFGNFNYRIESLGLNIVGTNVRDCTDAGGSTPSTCYANGNTAYSIIHQGPYWVRNHFGGLYAAPLFMGRIERARALAAERYITNPLSSADRALIEPYYRTEFQGRPMPGTFVLRIWDDPAVRFERFEDIQIVLNYRYWTRQE